MPNRRKVWLLMSALLLCAVPGCFELRSKLHYLGDKDLEHYKHEATEISYPNIQTELPEEIQYSAKPRTLLDRTTDEIWDMPLAEAIQLTLANNKVNQGNSQISFSAKTLLANPDAVSSIYDPAIQASGVLFGRRGMEAALADFDTQFTSRMIWGKDENIVNSQFTGAGGSPGQTLTEDTGVFEAALRKQFATGGILTVTHNWLYSGRNVTTQLFPSAYRGGLRTSYRHPLLAGGGTEFNRIAGPANPNFSAITGVSQGVVIARINQDLSLADFEAAVRNALRDTEGIYWDLYLRYRVYDTAVTARNSALRTWREADAKLKIGGVAGFKPADEAQARDRYFETRAQAESALSQIYVVEANLRRLLGLPLNDGRMIRPADEPTTAEFIPDWEASLVESLTRRVELRRQKWNIKSLELQLRAARMLTRPRLDFISEYRVNGFGDRLFGKNDNDGITTQGLASAYETLTQGNQTGWNLGFEFSMPLGFRSALSQVRNYELRVLKARQVLKIQEREISHELALAVQNLVEQYTTAQSNFNRRRAAERRVELFEAELNAGTATLDLVLRAQSSLADAEVAFYTSVINYNNAITSFHYATGTLLDNNNVHLAESEWTPIAYRDALRRAWARTHAFDFKFLKTSPSEFELPGGASVEVQLPSQPIDDGLPIPKDAVEPMLLPPAAPPADLEGWKPKATDHLPGLPSSPDDKQNSATMLLDSKIRQISFSEESDQLVNPDENLDLLPLTD